MARANPLKYLYATLTQGSADAFVQATITTGLLNLAKTCYIVRELFWEIGASAGASGQGSVAGAGYDIALTRKSQTAAPNLSDHSVIWKNKWFNAQTSAVGINSYVQTFRSAYDDSVLIVEDPIYAQLDSAASSTANTVYLRIGYEEASVSELDKLNFITASLSS